MSDAKNGEERFRDFFTQAIGIKEGFMISGKTNGWGTKLLAIGLIATGVLPLVGTTIPGVGLIVSGLAIAAGILMLMKV